MKPYDNTQNRPQQTRNRHKALQTNLTTKIFNKYKHHNIKHRKHKLRLEQ